MCPVNGERSKGHFGNLNLLSFSSAFPPSHETHDEKNKQVDETFLHRPLRKKSTVTIATLVPSDGQIPSSFPTPSFMLFFFNSTSPHTKKEKEKERFDDFNAICRKPLKISRVFVPQISALCRWNSVPELIGFEEFQVNFVVMDEDSCDFFLTFGSS